MARGWDVCGGERAIWEVSTVTGTAEVKIKGPVAVVLCSGALYLCVIFTFPARLHSPAFCLLSPYPLTSSPKCFPSSSSLLPSLLHLYLSPAAIRGLDGSSLPMASTGLLHSLYHVSFISRPVYNYRVFNEDSRSAQTLVKDWNILAEL